MTVHARGYRRFGGTLGRPWTTGVIASQGLGIALRRRAFRRLGVLYLGWLFVACVTLYLSVATPGMMQRGLFGLRGSSAPTDDAVALLHLDRTLEMFFTGVAVLTALLAVFVGSGLVSDDLGTGALALYLVRPISAIGYVMGKALVVPGILAVAILVPGAFLFLLTGLWRPPGETLPFLGGHLDVLYRIFEHYAVASAVYTGLILVLSSRSTRRAAVTISAAAVLILGVMLGELAAGGSVHGGLADVFLFLDLPRDTLTTFLWHAREHTAPFLWQPLLGRTEVLVAAFGLLLFGIWTAWSRVRSVEVVS